MWWKTGHFQEIFLRQLSIQTNALNRSDNRGHSTRANLCDLPSYCVTQKLPQTYTANHATFPIRKRKITVQICGKFRATQP